MKETILNDFDNALEGLIDELAAIPEDEINVVPFQGSWTAAQLAQHIVLSASSFDKMLRGPVEATEREPDKLIPEIRHIFLDYTTKMKSPDFIIPEERLYDKKSLLDTLENIRSSTEKAITELDLTQTCTGFELPVMGFLTRMEAIYFVVYHTQRHTHQLKNIVMKLG